MGEGFVVMQSNDVDIYYYMDEPGKCESSHLNVITICKILGFFFNVLN